MILDIGIFAVCAAIIVAGYWFICFLWMDDLRAASAIAFVFWTGLIAVIASAIYEDMNAERFSLRKDEWTCTSSHYESQPATYVSTGKVMVPVGGGSKKVCDNYARNQ